MCSIQTQQIERCRRQHFGATTFPAAKLVLIGRVVVAHVSPLMLHGCGGLQGDMNWPTANLDVIVEAAIRPDMAFFERGGLWLHCV